MNDNVQNDKDNRQSVRVRDRVLLSYAPVPVERYRQVAEAYSRGISPYNQEGLVDIQMYIGAQVALTRLKERDSDLAAFLQHLDSKVNLLLRKAGAETSPLDRLAFQEVSLGGLGLGFFTDEPFPIDTVLEFHLILLPHYTYIYCFSKVVNCEPAGADEAHGRYRIASKFILLLEEDQEKLIQHSFRQQSLALRNRRRQR